MFRVHRFLSRCALALVAAPALSLAATPSHNCGDFFDYRSTVSGAFLMSCTAADNHADPVQYSFDEAIEVCEDSHGGVLSEIKNNRLPAWRRRCREKGCGFDYAVIDLTDCRLASGYAYCLCDGTLDCREAHGGNFSGPLNGAECRAAVGAAYGEAVRMVRGCEGRAEGGSIHALGWCIAPTKPRAVLE